MDFYYLLFIDIWFYFPDIYMFNISFDDSVISFVVRGPSL